MLSSPSGSSLYYLQSFLLGPPLRPAEKGVSYWKLESKQGREMVNSKNGCVGEGGFGGPEEAKIAEGPALHDEPKCQEKLPWMKMGVLVLVWFSFFLVYIHRRNRYGQDVDDRGREGPANVLTFLVMALFTGLLGGIFGKGGGMLISPLSCKWGLHLRSDLLVHGFLLLGMEHMEIVLTFSFACFVASPLGLFVVQRAVRLYRSASLIAFSLGIVMALSTSPDLEPSRSVTTAFQEIDPTYKFCDVCSFVGRTGKFVDLER